ncbi:Bifunctional protein HldE [Phycisphaerae bacterium RAS1]|nr:Bifunctional protein HldE [Phycisphaerae bacterium RAS1]
MNRPLERKILPFPQVAETVRTQRAGGKTVVHCHGCFDIVHPGHVRYLQFARGLGDILVVSLTADAGVSKGPDRPYIPQELRAENLAALEFVDWVVIDPHPTACELLELLKPDIYVKGREYAHADDPRFRREREIIERGGGRVVFHSGDVVFSSTRLLETIGRDEQLDEQRLAALCRRNNITHAEVRQAIDSFAGVRAVVLGDIIREEYVLCDAGAVAEDAAVLSLSELGSCEYPGGAAAAARQLQALGGAAFLISAVGRDGASQAWEERLSEHDFTGYLLRNRTDMVTRRTFVADDGKLFKLTSGADAPLDSASERHVLGVVAEQLSISNLLLLCDHGCGFLTPALAAAAAGMARQLGVPVAGHAPAARAVLCDLVDTDLLTATERQFREAVHDMNSGISAVAWNVLSRSRGRTAIVSLRKRGLLSFDGRGDDAALDRLRSEFVPTPGRHFIDQTGADEALLAAAALTIAGGGGLPVATYIAAGAEAAAATRQGGDPVTQDELCRWFTRRPELGDGGRFIPSPETAAVSGSIGVSPVRVDRAPQHDGRTGGTPMLPRAAVTE